MALAEAYRVEATSVDARGLSFGDDDLDDFAGPVQHLLADVDGVDEARAALAHLPGTEFEHARLEEILTSADVTTPEWKVGEALAEHLLVSEHDCEFPWPHSRSQRNPNSSDGGADLVGFHHVNGSTRFALGEIKTSSQKKSPPALLTGRHGLTTQLDGLARYDDRARWAVRYLAMQAVGRSWLPLYQQSFRRYLTDPADVSIFGAVVRTTPENINDLKKAAEDAEPLMVGTLSFVLLALYVGTSGLSHLAGCEIDWETSE